jgi:hypothetical protein
MCAVHAQVKLIRAVAFCATVLYAVGCSKENHVEKEVADPNFEGIQHNLRSIVGDNWTLESWTDGALYSPLTGINITLKLSRRDARAEQLPAIRYELQLIPGGEGAGRTARGEVPFKEVVKGVSWQAKIKDAFHSSLSNAGTKELPLGDHLISIRLEILGGEQLQIQNVPVKVAQLRY